MAREVNDPFDNFPRESWGMHLDGRRRGDGIHERESAEGDERGAYLGASFLAVLRQLRSHLNCTRAWDFPPHHLGEKTFGLGYTAVAYE